MLPDVSVTGVPRQLNAVNCRPALGLELVGGQVVRSEFVAVGSSGSVVGNISQFCV